MPWRAMTREQGWMLPPSLDELLADDHPARVVAAFVDGLSAADWAGLGVDLGGQALGGPAYHPRALLSIWLYGFMSGTRSSRRLEAACREQLPMLWLSGSQQPDHNTLWRFYKQHRERMRGLLQLTVRTAVRLNLVDWAVQAVDGTKVAGAAAPQRTLDAEQLERLLQRTERAIVELEAQNEAGEGAAAPRLPAQLQAAKRLREQVEAARRELLESDRRHTNLTDPQARLLRGRDGWLTGYNAQAMAAPLRGGDPADSDGAAAGGGGALDERPNGAADADHGQPGDALQPGGSSGGMLLLAAEVSQDPADTAQLLPLIEAAEASGGGRRAALTVADAGYFAAANLSACAARGAAVVIPEPRAPSNPDYHYSQFHYEPAADCYRCPAGQPLQFRGLQRRRRRTPARVYAAKPAVCRACPAFGRCTSSPRGRQIKVSIHAQALQAHRGWMQTEAARQALRSRQGLIEPVFGIIKEQQAGRRFLLRGLAAVSAEWSLLAVAFNLRMLSRRWPHRRAGGPPQRGRRSAAPPGRRHRPRTPAPAARRTTRCCRHRPRPRRFAPRHRSHPQPPS